MTYQPPAQGDRLDGMEWTGEAWTPVCPDCDVAMTVFNESAELCCPDCWVSFIARVRAVR